MNEGLLPLLSLPLTGSTNRLIEAHAFVCCELHFREGISDSGKNRLTPNFIRTSIQYEYDSPKGNRASPPVIRLMAPIP